MLLANVPNGAAVLDHHKPNQSGLRYFPLALYEIGLCHYGRKDPYKTIEIASENLLDAMDKARKALAPNIVQHICHVRTRPNPEFIEEQNRWLLIRQFKTTTNSQISQ